MDLQGRLLPITQMLPGPEEGFSTLLRPALWLKFVQRSPEGLIIDSARCNSGFATNIDGIDRMDLPKRQARGVSLPVRGARYVTCVKAIGSADSLSLAARRGYEVIACARPR